MAASMFRRAQPDIDALRRCVPRGHRGGCAMGGVGTNGDTLLRACHGVSVAPVSLSGRCAAVQLT